MSNPDFDAAALAAQDAAAGRKLFRAYVTISMDFALDTRATDDKAAWEVIQRPENRHLLARRIQQLDEMDLARIIALNGVVEELDEQAAQVPPAGTIFSTNEERGGRLIYPNQQQAGPLG